jgi:hypothetical protein
MKHGFLRSAIGAMAGAAAGVFLLALFPACPQSGGEAECKITFDGGVSTVPNSVITLAAGDVLSVLPDPLGGSAGLFRGWFDREAGGEKIVPPYTVTKSATFYAYWYDAATGNSWDLVFDAGADGVLDENGERTLTKNMRLGTSTLKIFPFPRDSGGANAFTGWVYNTGAEFTRLTTAGSVALDTGSGTRPVNAAWASGSKDFAIVFDSRGGLFDPEAPASGTKTITISAPARVTVGEDWPGIPFREGWNFLRYDDAQDSTALEFTRDTKVWKDQTIYAQWAWNRENPDQVLKLHHDFAPERISDTVITPLKAPAEGTYTATMAGSDGTTGSKEIGDKTFYYYKTGAKGAMNSAGTSYLNLGAGAGSVLKAAASGYTIAAYVRIDGNTSGNGNFIWAFAETSNTQQWSGKGIWFSAPSHVHATSIGGWGSGNVTNITSPGTIASGRWIHVAYTQDGTAGPNNAALYFDGTEVARGTVTTHIGGAGTLTHNTLGGPNFSADYNLSETMFADLRIYDAALGEEHIRALAGDLAALNSVDWP